MKILQQFLVPKYTDRWTADTAISKWIKDQTVSFRTAQTYIGTLKGALGRVLGNCKGYRKFAQHKDWIRQSSVSQISPLDDLQRLLKKGSVQENVKKAKPMSTKDLDFILGDLETTRQMRSTLIVGFLLGARVGDLCRKKNHFKFSDQHLVAHWRDHKTSVHIGAKKVQVEVPERWQKDLRHIKGKCNFASKKEIAQILQYNGMTLHSLRRGGLSYHFKISKSLETTLLISLHTSQKALMKYLDGDDLE